MLKYINCSVNPKQPASNWDNLRKELMARLMERQRNSISTFLSDFNKILNLFQKKNTVKKIKDLSRKEVANLKLKKRKKKKKKFKKSAYPIEEINLNNVIQNQEVNKCSAIKEILQCEKLILTFKYEKAKEILHKIEKTVWRSEYKFLLLFYLGHIFDMQSNYEKSLGCFRDCLLLWSDDDKDNWLKKRGVVFQRIGIIYQKKSNYEESLEYYKKALLINEQLKDISSESKTLYQIGNVYYLKSEYEKALNYYQKANKIYIKIYDYSGKAKVLHQIGMVYEKMKDFLTSLKNYKMSLLIQNKHDDIKTKPKTLHQIGVIYEYNSDIVTALKYYKESLQMNKRICDQAGIADCNYNIGRVFFMNQKFEESKSYFEEAIKIWSDGKIKFNFLQKAKNYLSIVVSEIEKISLKNIQSQLLNKNITKCEHFHFIKRIGLRNIDSYYYYHQKDLTSSIVDKGNQLKGNNSNKRKYFGCGAVVFKVLSSTNKDFPLAMKICYNYGYKDVESIFNEFILTHKISEINHPNIMDVLYHFVGEVDYSQLPNTDVEITKIEKKSAIMIFPYCKKNLKQVFTSKRYVMDEFLFLKYLKDILEAINVLYKNGIVHRDLKPDNIMVSEHDNLLITDFELKLKLSDNLRIKYEGGFLKGGARPYLPPEIMKAKVGEILDYSKSDIFSVGVISYEMANSIMLDESDIPNKEPFNGKSTKYVNENDYVELNPRISFEIRDLIKRMIHPDFNKRIHCIEALKIVKELLDKRMKEKLDTDRKIFNSI